MWPKAISARTQAAAFVAALSGFAALAAAYETNAPLVRVDAEIAIGFHERVTAPATFLLQAISALGSTSFLAVVTALAAGWLAGRDRRVDVALVVACFAGSQALTWTLKAIFHRERPSFADPVATASSFSFPSGHALASLAVYGALVYVFASRNVLAAAALLVAAIGLSRVYLGAHYLSDVLAGYSAGLALLLLAIGLSGGARRSDARRATCRRG